MAMNANLQNFLFGALAAGMNYAAAKVANPKQANWVETRNQIYIAAFGAAAQELQERAAKMSAAPQLQQEQQPNQ